MPSNSPSRARLCLEVLAERCLPSTYGLGSLVPVSQGDPFATCTADSQGQSGTLYPNTALETWLVVDPTNPNHLAGLWQRDRWSGGGARGLELGISFDGGQTWQDSPLPGAGACAGGTSLRASDPWLAFDVNGGLYAAFLTVTGGGSPGDARVAKSNDGGLTWQTPVMVPNSFGADKESIMTDPSNPNNAYLVWTGAYSRTTDGGRTWAAARSLPTGSGSQVVVLPDGTLLDSDGCELFRSHDQGQTWPDYVPYFLNCDPVEATDPNTHQSLRAGLGLGDIVADPHSGAVYDVIEDARVGGGNGIDDGIAFTRSLDDGLTWSTPVKVNQTPTGIPAANQQAFIPTVSVAADGTVGLTYYDFRFNQIGANNPLLTDYWFVPGTPSPNGISWGTELRLTDTSFNYENAPFSVYGKMIGDYQGRFGDGNDLLNLFGESPTGVNTDAIFFRRVIKQGRGLGVPHQNPISSQPVAPPQVITVGPTSPAAPGPDSSTGQPLSLDVPALPDGASASPVPAAPLTDNNQGLNYAALASAVDGTLLAAPLSDGLDGSGANGTI